MEQRSQKIRRNIFRVPADSRLLSFLGKGTYRPSPEAKSIHWIHVARHRAIRIKPAGSNAPRPRILNSTHDSRGHRHQIPNLLGNIHKLACQNSCLQTFIALGFSREMSKIQISVLSLSPLSTWALQHLLVGPQINVGTMPL